jgi:hypothetical protein
MADSKYLISADDFLLKLEEYNSGRQFISESPFKGQIYDNEDLIRELGDTVIRVFKINSKTFGKPVDITEECAQEYLVQRYRHLSQARLSDEPTFPDYVKKSGVWRDFKDDVSMRWPIESPTHERRLVAYIDTMTGHPVGANLHE